MIDPANVPAVSDEELLARFILSSRHIRSSNQTVKPDAFIPPANNKSSVTRHRDASEVEIWHEGERVGRLREKSLQDEPIFKHMSRWLNNSRLRRHRSQRIPIMPTL
jgi:hypothetical protein